MRAANLLVALNAVTQTLDHCQLNCNSSFAVARRFSVSQGTRVDSLEQPLINTINEPGVQAVAEPFDQPLEVVRPQRPPLPHLFESEPTASVLSLLQWESETDFVGDGLRGRLKILLLFSKKSRDNFPNTTEKYC
jgi:hypothetical protein